MTRDKSNLALLYWLTCCNKGVIELVTRDKSNLALVYWLTCCNKGVIELVTRDKSNLALVYLLTCCYKGVIELVTRDKSNLALMYWLMLMILLTSILSYGMDTYGLLVQVQAVTFTCYMTPRSVDLQLDFKVCDSNFEIHILNFKAHTNNTTLH